MEAAGARACVGVEELEEEEDGCASMARRDHRRRLITFLPTFYLPFREKSLFPAPITSQILARVESLDHMQLARVWQEE